MSTSSAFIPFTLYAPDLFPDALLSARGTYGAAFEIALSQGAGHPVMIHEMGASTAQFSPERVAAYDRAQMYSGLGAGSIGVDLWCYTDASPAQFHKAPYLRTPQETGWGMTTWDRQDKPLAREFKKFAQVVSHTWIWQASHLRPRMSPSSFPTNGPNPMAIFHVSA